MRTALAVATPHQRTTNEVLRRWPPKAPTSTSTQLTSPSLKTMPYRCKGCKSYFSVRTGALAHTRVPLRKWAQQHAPQTPKLELSKNPSLAQLLCNQLYVSVGNE